MSSQNRLNPPNQIKIEYCLSKDMVAHALTKALLHDRHWKLTRKIGLESVKHFKSGSIGFLGMSNAGIKRTKAPGDQE